jgi:hypothetical protein
MKKTSILILFTILFASACAQSEKYKWLVGTWKLKGKEVYESWAFEKSENTLRGTSYKLNASDTTILETLRLIYREGKYYYIPDVAGTQGPIEFAITSSDDQMFRAENPKHDFPKVIQYDFVRNAGNADVINAFIEGDGKRIPYIFERVR